MKNTKAGMRFALCTVALDAMGIGIIIPVMPELLMSLGYSNISDAALWGGALATVYALMQFLFSPLLGNLSDRFGRRPVILTSLVALALDYVILCFASSLWLLLVGRAIAGIAGATHATATAYVADISPSGERAKRFGQLGAMFGLGFVFGPALGGLVGEWDVRAPFMLAAALSAANFLFGYFFMPESLPPQRRRAFSWRRANPFMAIQRAIKLPALGPLLLGYLLFALGGHVYPVIWPYWGNANFGWGAQTIGLSVAVYGVCMACSQGLLMHRIVARFGEARAVIIGVGTAAVAASIFGFVNTGWLAFALLPLAALSELATPALSAIMSNRVSGDEQGELQGVLASLMAATNVITPAIYSGMFYYFTAESTAQHLPGAPFLLAALLLALVLPLIWKSLHGKHGELD